MSTSLESYAHKAAKAVVVQWFREAAETAGHDEYAKCLGVSWRVNRAGPGWGVWEEYPITHTGEGLEIVWDESWVGWDPIACAERNLQPDEDIPTEGWALPTFEQLASDGRCPVAILDIAIQHKGTIAAGIEIVHKHDLTPSKALVLHGMGLQDLLRIPTSWILGQVSCPEHLPEAFEVIRGGSLLTSALQRPATTKWDNKISERKVVASVIFKGIRADHSETRIMSAAYQSGRQVGLSRDEVNSVAHWVVRQIVSGNSSIRPYRVR